MNLPNYHAEFAGGTIGSIIECVVLYALLITHCYSATAVPFPTDIQIIPQYSLFLPPFLSTPTNDSS
jgi:hypothetical protein